VSAGGARTALCQNELIAARLGTCQDPSVETLHGTDIQTGNKYQFDVYSTNRLFLLYEGESGLYAPKNKFDSYILVFIGVI
jgi:hypothetical protein